MDKFNIIFNEKISDNILNKNLTDLFFKHVFRNNRDCIQLKAGKLYTESVKLGYNECEWGVHSGHPSDILFHIGKITKMEKDNYYHAVRIIICKYDFCDSPIDWIDYLHSAI